MYAGRQAGRDVYNICPTYGKLPSRFPSFSLCIGIGDKEEGIKQTKRRNDNKSQGNNQSISHPSIIHQTPISFHSVPVNVPTASSQQPAPASPRPPRDRRLGPEHSKSIRSIHRIVADQQQHHRRSTRWDTQASIHQTREIPTQRPKRAWM